MGKIILEEQVEASTPASNKVAIYPKAGGGIYKKADDGVESLLATKAYVDTSIAGVDEHSEMLGLTIGDDHTQYIRVDGTRAFTGNVSIDVGKELRWYDDDSSDYVALKAPAVSSTITWTLPDAGGTGLTPIDNGFGVLVMGGHDDLNGYLATEHFIESSITHTNITAGDGSDHADVASNTSASHTQSHAITSTADHSGGTWKVIYSDGSGDWQEVALGASGTVLTSQGVGVAPIFV